MQVPDGPVRQSDSQTIVGHRGGQSDAQTTDVGPRPASQTVRQLMMDPNICMSNFPHPRTSDSRVRTLPIAAGQAVEYALKHAQHDTTAKWHSAIACRPLGLKV